MYPRVKYITSLLKKQACQVVLVSLIVHHCTLCPVMCEVDYLQCGVRTVPTDWRPSLVRQTGWHPPKTPDPPTLLHLRFGDAGLSPGPYRRSIPTYLLYCTALYTVCSPSMALSTYSPYHEGSIKYTKISQLNRGSRHSK